MMMEFDSLSSSLRYYLERIVSGFWIKSMLALIVTFFLDVLFGDVAIINIYFFLTVTDLTLGIIKAKVANNFKVRLLGNWMRKLLAHCLFVVVIGLLFYQYYRASNNTVQIVNWLIILCSLTEASSIVHNMRILGLPIPADADAVLAFLRKHFKAKIHMDPDEMTDFSIRESAQEAKEGKHDEQADYGGDGGAGRGFSRSAVAGVDRAENTAK